MVGAVLFLLCVYVVYIKKYKLTQTRFLYLTVLALICLLTFFAFSYYVKREISAYNALRTYFMTAYTKGCVISKTWATVLRLYVKHTSMDGMDNVLFGLLITYGLLFLVGVVLLWYVFKTLGK